jgi:hypothetical protein
MLGVAIQPIVFPLNKGTATRLEVYIQQHHTAATTCQTYWELKTEEGVTLDQSHYTLTEEQFDNWGADNNVVNQYVADAIGVVLI